MFLIPPVYSTSVPTTGRAESRLHEEGFMTMVADEGWAKHVADILRRNDIRLFATVPDFYVFVSAKLAT
jgi:hypothetical protein